MSLTTKQHQVLHTLKSIRTTGSVTMAKGVRRAPSDIASIPLTASQTLNVAHLKGPVEVVNGSASGDITLTLPTADDWIAVCDNGKAYKFNIEVGDVHSHNVILAANTGGTAQWTTYGIPIGTIGAFTRPVGGTFMLLVGRKLSGEAVVSVITSQSASAIA